MLALIDGDILRYRCGFAVEHGEYRVYVKGEEMLGPIAVFRYKKDIPEEYTKDQGLSIEKHVEVEPLENALQAVKVTIESILQETGATEYRLFLTGENNFRDTVSTTRVYKGNRDAHHKPRWYEEIKGYMIEQHGAEVVDGMEADDAMGIVQWGDYSQFEYEKRIEASGGDNYTSAFVKTIICSIDKDMDMIPGWHYNFVKKLKYWIDEDDALRNFYTQLLAGDIVDNIQGISGVGMAGARKILAGCRTGEEMFAATKSRYVDAYNDKADALLKEMASLVWIKRQEEEPHPLHKYYEQNNKEELHEERASH